MAKAPAIAGTTTGKGKEKGKSSAVWSHSLVPNIPTCLLSQAEEKQVWFTVRHYKSGTFKYGLFHCHFGYVRSKLPVKGIFSTPILAACTQSTETSGRDSTAILLSILREKRLFQVNTIWGPLTSLCNLYLYIHFSMAVQIKIPVSNSSVSKDQWVMYHKI